MSHGGNSVRNLYVGHRRTLIKNKTKTMHIWEKPCLSLIIYQTS